MNVARRYTEAAASTASKERLLSMLFEAALRHMRAGAAALEAGRAADANVPLTKACEIVTELQATLDQSKAPQLVDQLGAVYTFVSLRLLQANLKRDAQLAREAERAFAPVADGFIAAIASLPGSETR